MTAPTNPPTAFEDPTGDRPTAAAPTEMQLEQETPGTPGAKKHDPYAALRFRDCRLFLIGYIIAVVGDQIQFTAVGWDLFHRTGRAMSLGWAGLVQAAPVMVLSVPAGQLADSLSRRRIVIFSQAGSAICSVLLAVVSHYGFGVQWMYLALGLGATFQAIGWPARSALLPATVPTEHFSNAATWNSSGFQVAAMVGPALGGWILFHSVVAAYLADTLGAGLYVFFLLQLSEKPATIRKGTNLKSLLAGIRFVRETPIILATITMDLFAVLLGGVTCLLPIYATQILHVGSVGFGWLRAAPALGATLMALTLAHRAPMKHAGRSLLLSVGGFGIATIVFGLSTNFWLSLAMLFFTGALDNISVVVRHTLVQVMTPDEMRGRVSAVNNVFIGASNQLGEFESGLTAGLFGPVISAVAGGIGTIAVVAMTAMVWPQVRRFGSLDGKTHAAIQPHSQSN